MVSRSSAPRKVAAPEARLCRGDAEALTRSLAVLDGHRRDKLLEAVAAAAKELLRSSDLAVSLPKVTEEIGTATGVDRAHIFLIDGAGGDGQILQHYLWTLPGLSTPAEFKNPSMPMANAGLSSWIPRLQRGETITGHTGDFVPAARALFEKGGVKSVLCVPVFADGQWKGMIGFDDCRSERNWSAAEIDVIGTLAELVGGAVARISHLKQLADANRIIESSPTILYRLGAQAPFPLTYISQNISRYGYDANELLAKPNEWPGLIETEDLPDISANINLLVVGQADHIRLDFRLKKPDGAVVWFDGEGYALRNAAGTLTAIEGVLNDVTERKHKAIEITALARTDSLTGLPNRAAFLDRLKLEFARAAAARALPCIISTSTISKTSTTRLAIRSATSSCVRWRSGWRRACARPTWSPASVATSSRCCRTMSATAT